MAQISSPAPSVGQSALPGKENDLATSSRDDGTICEVKELYWYKKDAYDRGTWTTEIPDDVAEVVETDETAKYALLVRKEKCYDGRRKFSIHSIVVQSPTLKKILTDVFKGYTGLTINVPRLEFLPSWQCFVHRWSKLSAMRDELTSRAHELGEESEAAEQRDCLILLYNVLKEELQETISLRDDLLRQGLITHKMLWTLFEPGSTILHDKTKKAAKIVSSTQSSNSYRVTSLYIDWNGTNFGWVTQNENISEHQGTRPILSLPIYPLACRKDKDNLEQKIIARSIKFESLCGFRYKRYDGVAKTSGTIGQSKCTVHSRIVLDTEAWNDLFGNAAVNTARMGHHGHYNRASNQEAVAVTDELGREGIKQPDGIPDNCRLTREQLLITNTQLRGYSTKDKKWMYFDTENISDITWDENAFDNLILPSEHKELIRFVVESQALNSEYFDNTMSEKGQGLILLLNGPPGVGKTSTAEAVAEVMKVPLYYMSSADLGSSVSSIENCLADVFKKTTKWKAVLLIDEADNFLQTRTNRNLEQHTLVSAFLRMLESYTGTIFLSTNGVEDIDPAFRSRIHVRLNYDPLSALSRETIWRRFVGTVTYPHEFEEEDYRLLAEKDLNGRQIKNLLKTAVLLAAGKGESLDRSHVEFVLAVDPQF